MGVTALTFLAVRAAVLVIAQLALTLVVVDPVTVQVTPAPAVTEVAPVRLVPLTVTSKVVLCVPVVGAIDVTVGPCTVNAAARGLVAPLGGATLTLLDVSHALAGIVEFAVTVVAVAVPVIA